MKILVIEDERALREIIQKALEKEHFLVEFADSYQAALGKIGIYSYDCILLDIMLPDGNGLKLLELMKREKIRDNVIIVSAKDSLEDKIKGLDLGADDYLAKPFHLTELIARIRSVIRRNNNNGDTCIEIGNIKFFPDKNKFLVNDKELTLGRKEYDILQFFVNRSNHLISKDVLAEAIWGDNVDVLRNFDFIYAQIKNIRKKMKELGASYEIKAIYGFGYKLMETTEV